MSEKEIKITNIKQKMARLNKDTPMYMAYSDILRGLERKEVRLHVDTGDKCESCT